ncbi:MAG: hypothetical protein K6G88_12185 [Lachnospiraceae bacterium]|nr:hypothetical protein [Lachnospiraceae bacterium]
MERGCQEFLREKQNLTTHVKKNGKGMSEVSKGKAKPDNPREEKSKEYVSSEKER